MARKKVLAILATLALVSAQKPQFPPAFPPTPALPASVNYAPSVLPNVQDPTAPDAQKECPGYRASNVVETESGLTADLTLAGDACNVYGIDVVDLSLSVEYQSKERLAVRIVPRYLEAKNESLYVLDPKVIPAPSREDGANSKGSDLKFVWSNSPSFSFKVERASSGEVLFDTTGTVIVFEDQFLELATSMVPDYNIYGLPESLHSFRLGNNWTQTFWASYNLNNDNVIDVNGHSTHPIYMETRYGNGSSKSHGVYARNAHGQDWLLRSDNVTYRTIGGSFDLYFLGGDQPKQVISQYQTQCILGTPFLPAYWTLGFMQVRWGYQNWTNLQEVLDLYAEQQIQLEIIANDLDYMLLDRDFTNDPGHYDLDAGHAFLEKLHVAGQYWFPILDPNIYRPDPTNSSDVYDTWTRGDELQAYIRNGEEYYNGVLWPGISSYVDFLVDQGQRFWTGEFVRFYAQLAYDGFWLDVSDATSFVTYSLPDSAVAMNPIHVPFALPGDPNTSVAVDYHYPEKFEITNATEAASASSALAFQSSAYPTSATPTPTHQRTQPTPGVRQLNFPPYAIKNDAVPGNSLVKNVLAPNATHNDGPYNTTEYAVHNLYGHLSSLATYNALKAARPGLRPFNLARSTFAGTGAFAGHWGGDTASSWGNMYFGIEQALQFSLAGIPYFGVETCGFRGNSDMELCTRWMQLSAWFPLYRNHNSRNTIAQEAYRWATTAEATRNIMNIRYSLLPYTYTLFYKAHTAGETVLRALPWEFPDDESLKAVETQFMSGPAILVTPVLEALATSVKGVFPGVANGAIWYDWYTLEAVEVQPGENKTLDAPLTYQPIHVRGGSIVPMQKAGNTTATSRKSPWSLLIALDKNGEAEGSLYLDDGVSLVQNATKYIEMSFSNGALKAKVSGTFNDGLPLANVTIAGVEAEPKSVSINMDGQEHDCDSAKSAFNDGVLTITDLESATSGGIWSGDVTIKLNEQGSWGGHGSGWDRHHWQADWGSHGWKGES